MSSSPTSQRQTSVSQSVDIPGVTPARVFDFLTEPANHATNDASGHVMGPIGPDRLTGKGDRFGMKMKWIVPYRVTNTVVEFEPDERIAWRHFAGHRWRYELAPINDGTRVTETFDLSPVPTPFHAVYRTTLGFPDAYEENLRGSLEQLREHLGT